jgi:hypothetical protein
MALKASGYSPQIKIYLAVGERTIFLSDLMYHSARLLKSEEVSPGTRAFLVLSIDGVEDREEIILDQGIASHQAIITFSYTDPTRIDGRQLPS